MQRLYYPVKEGGVCWCCLQAFAQHKQSSWYQWHEVQWWDGLVGTATWGWGVLARLQLFLDVVFRSWRGESEGEGMEVEKRLCHIMIAAHWRSKRDGERGEKKDSNKAMSFNVWRREEKGVKPNQKRRWDKCCHSLYSVWKQWKTTSTPQLQTTLLSNLAQDLSISWQGPDPDPFVDYVSMTPN